jgi:hypothetical protein
VVRWKRDGEEELLGPGSLAAMREKPERTFKRATPEEARRIAASLPPPLGWPGANAKAVRRAFDAQRGIFRG